MNGYEIFSLSCTVTSLILTVINIVFYAIFSRRQTKIAERQNEISKKQEEISEQQTLISQGEAETSIRELISACRREVFIYAEKKITSRSAELDKESVNDVYDAMFNAAQEDLRNAYEEACARYLDGKVDKERFKRIYATEIRNPVESKEQKEYFDSVSSPYRSIIKVYNEWPNQEN